MKRIVSAALRKKRQSFGRKARRMSPLSRSEAIAGRPNKQKEKELQARIEMIVAQAKMREADQMEDVMNRRFRFTGKAIRVG